MAMIDVVFMFFSDIFLDFESDSGDFLGYMNFLKNKYMKAAVVKTTS